MEAYTSTLERILSETQTLGILEGCATCYVGGGTPSLLGDRLIELVTHVQHCAPTIFEFSCEANPESFTAPLAASLHEAGVTRVSLGVQSLQEDELKALGRAHGVHEASRAVSCSVGLGLSTSLDLMCAIPQQTIKSWKKTLNEALSLNPQHISVYPLIIEEGTPLSHKVGSTDSHWNEPEVQAEMMELAEALLSSAGYQRYEVASYALPGHRCAHNLAYWSGIPYLGLGTGAASMMGVDVYQKLRSLFPRLPEVVEGYSRVRLTITTDRFAFACAKRFADLDFDIEFLTPAQAYLEDAMLALRTTEGLSYECVEQASTALDVCPISATATSDVLIKTLGDLEQAGLLERTLHGDWKPTHRGWLLGNELYGRIWELAPGTVVSTSTVTH